MQKLVYNDIYLKFFSFKQKTAVKMNRPIRRTKTPLPHFFQFNIMRKNLEFFRPYFDFIFKFFNFFVYFHRCTTFNKSLNICVHFFISSTNFIISSTASINFSVVILRDSILYISIFNCLFSSEFVWKFLNLSKLSLI